MQEISISRLDPSRFDDILDPDSAKLFAQALDEAREALSGRTLWHVNSTSTGGGVAEMLQAVLGYLLGAGIETRWVVTDGNEEFFVVTKRIHHLLHGDDAEPGPGTAPFGPAEHEIYCEALAPEAASVTAMVSPGDVVILHDPQTAGLAPDLRSAGARVIWNCHVGSDVINAATEVVWSFLRPFVEATHGQVFSRHQYIWPGLDLSQVAVIPPCIDAVAPKNQFLDEETVTRVHIACLPMSDAEENAAIVNALQRRSDAVIQKSLAEGFGLTVAEAMWKARPMIASGVGRIQDQIEDGVSGILLADPQDRAEFGSAVTGILSDPAFAARLGQAAHDSVRDHYLAPVYLMRYPELSQTVLAGL